MTRERLPDPSIVERAALRSVSRRRLVQWTALGAGSAALGLHAASGSAAARTGFAQDATPATAKQGGAYILGTPQPIQTLDPHTPVLANNRNLFPGLFNALMRFQNEVDPQPELAESVDMSDDGLTVTFTLRQGVKFHNGREMTADDVKFSMDRIKNPETGSAFMDYLADVETVEVADKYTVRFLMKNPSGFLLGALTYCKILPQDAGADLATNAVGTGPYKLAEYVVNDRVVMERFADYWESGKPHMDSVTIKTIADPNALFTALTTGTVDTFWLLPTQFLQQVEGTEELYLLEPTTPSSFPMLMVDNSSEPFNDKRARQALLHIMDKQTMLEVAYNGVGTPALTNNPTPPGHWSERAGLKEYPYDPQTAKELFDAVGVKELRFVAPTSLPEFRPVAELLERSLNEIGIELQIELVEVNEWINVFIPVGTKYPNTITVNIISPTPDPVPTWQFALIPNILNFANEELATLVSQGRTTVDQAQRTEIYGRIQEIWNEEAPMPVILHYKWLHAVSQGVRDLRTSYEGFLEYQDAWLDR